LHLIGEVIGYIMDTDTVQDAFIQAKQKDAYVKRIVQHILEEKFTDQ